MTEADDEEQHCRVHVADRQALPDRLAEGRQTVERVKGALGRLAEERRRAVVLHLQELTTDEIARALGWSEPKARHLVYRGLKDLRRVLRDQGIECEVD